MTVTEFVSDINTLNSASKFKMNFDSNGGYITFYNTSGKAFVIGLSSIKQIFIDIKDNLSEFTTISTYDEKKWRDTCSYYFNDESANTMSTVQTKPLFSTISKILSIAIRDLNSYNDNEINLTEENVDLTITFLESLINHFVLNPDSLIGEKDYAIEEKHLKKIIFEAFKILLTEYSDGILDNHSLKESVINKTNIYQGLSLPEYFGSDNLIGIFTTPQSKNDLKSSNTIRFFEEPIKVLGKENCYFTTQWNGKGTRGLSLNSFNVYLKEKSDSKFEIIKDGDIFKLIKNGTTIKEEHITFDNTNTIYYGAPGTGKSYKVDQIINSIDKEFYERVTFHPEYDNAAFVGSFRPIMCNDNIHYKFVAQPFTDIYTRAWKGLKKNQQYYLIIEEINRGNCSEIFGEIFQLLDRDSNYTVSPSTELKHYLEQTLGANHLGIKDGLKLPPNLAILATMNTSDQSLYPMDSAFKRRWNWEYIPICYERINELGDLNESYSYMINFEVINHDGTIENFSSKWINFIQGINNIISMNPILGMDKCIGNYFVKPNDKEGITLNQFINKVVFYLWNDVFKDEEDSIFSEHDLNYESFFPLKSNGAKNTKLLIEKYSKS